MVRALFFAFALMVAPPALAQGAMVATHTGLSGGYSAELLVSQHRHFSVYAQGTVTRRGDQIAHTVMLHHGVGDGSILFIDEAWSYGRPVAFEPLPPDRVCGGLRCLYAMGVLVFSPSDYARLAQTGIDLQLIGSEGPIDLSIPPRIFSEAATEAAALWN